MIVGAIVLAYCMHKKKKEREAGMNEFSTSGGNTTGRNIELIGDQTKRNYL